MFSETRNFCNYFFAKPIKFTVTVKLADFFCFKVIMSIAANAFSALNIKEENATVIHNSVGKVRILRLEKISDHQKTREKTDIMSSPDF